MTIMRDIGNVDGNVENSKKLGKLVKAKAWVLSEDQVDDSKAFPIRVGRDVGTIALLPGEYWHYLKTVHTKNPELALSADVGDVAANLKNAVSLLFGGVEDNLLTLVERGITRGFYLVIEVCSTGKRYLIGNGCKPAIMVAPEGGFTNDQTSLTVNFESQCGEFMSNYIGTITTQEAETVAAAATAIAIVTGNDSYKFESDAVGAVKTTTSGLTDADVNRVVTIIGGGGADPSKISNASDFILIAGDQWEGVANAQISFKIFKDGAGSYKLIEVAGSRS